MDVLGGLKLCNIVPCSVVCGAQYLAFRPVHSLITAGCEKCVNVGVGHSILHYVSSPVHFRPSQLENCINRVNKNFNESTIVREHRQVVKRLCFASFQDVNLSRFV